MLGDAVIRLFNNESSHKLIIRQFHYKGTADRCNIWLQLSEVFKRISKTETLRQGRGGARAQSGLESIRLGTKIRNDATENNEGSLAHSQDVD